MQPFFRLDNTEGYTQDHLDALNERFRAAGGDQLEPESLEWRHFGECVQRDFDSEPTRTAASSTNGSVRL